MVSLVSPTLVVLHVTVTSTPSGAIALLAGIYVGDTVYPEPAIKYKGPFKCVPHTLNFLVLCWGSKYRLKALVLINGIAVPSTVKVHVAFPLFSLMITCALCVPALLGLNVIVTAC